MSNRDGLGPVENRKHVTVVWLGGQHTSPTLWPQGSTSQFGEGTRPVTDTQNRSPEGSPSGEGRPQNMALGYSAGSRGSGQPVLGFADLAVGIQRREPPRLLTVTLKPSSRCGLKDAVPWLASQERFGQAVMFLFFFQVPPPQVMESFGDKVQALAVSRAGPLYKEWSPWGDAEAGCPLEICRQGPAHHKLHPLRDSEILCEGGHTASRP